MQLGIAGLIIIQVFIYVGNKYYLCIVSMKDSCWNIVLADYKKPNKQNWPNLRNKYIFSAGADKVIRHIICSRLSFKCVLQAVHWIPIRHG